MDVDINCEILGSNKTFNKVKGNCGEAIACVWLENEGLKVIESNYKNKHGEIDIIATKDGVWHFIEVKMRGSDVYGHGREAVGAGKQNRIRRAAQYYLIEKELHDSVYSCFDVVEINGRVDDYEIEFLENCF